MKKLVGIFIISLLSVGMLFANGSSESASEKMDNASKGDATTAVSVNDDGTVNNPELVKTDPNKLVFWSLFSGGDGDFMDQIVSDYNKTNPTMQVQTIMLVWADYYTKLMTAVAAGKGPDIGVSHVSSLPYLYAQGALAPIDVYTKAAGTDWSQYTESMKTAVSFDGEYYAMPLDTHAEILYFNTDWLKKAGIMLDSTGKLKINSVSDFTHILKMLKAEAGDGQCALALTNVGDDPYRIWWAIYYQMGGTPLINEAGNKITLDKTTAVKAAQYVKSLYDDGYILEGIGDHQKFFAAGNSGLEFGGTWAIGQYEKTNGLHFGAQSMPSLFNNSGACWADAHTLTIPVNKKRTEKETQAAVDFINYVSSVGSTTWAQSGQIPSDIDVQNSTAFNNLPYRSNYKSAAKLAVLPPGTEYFNAMKSDMIVNLDTIWSEQNSAEVGISNMIDELKNEIL